MSDWWSYRLSDFLLFSPRTWYRLIELYNRDLWPAQLLWVGLGLAVLLQLRREGERGARLIWAGVAVAWISVGFGFHWRRYSEINWAATWFALAFAVQSGGLLWSGVYRRRLRFGDVRSARGRAGLGLLAFAIVLMPIIDPVLGRGWIHSAVFGVMPDPTAVATLGLLLVTERPGWLLAPIPLLWCLVSGATLLALGSPEAWIPPLAGLLAVVLLVRRR